MFLLYAQLSDAKAIASAVFLRLGHPFHALVNMVAETLSPSLRRVYRHTYDSWCAFTDCFQIDYLDLSFARISAFLQEPDAAHDPRLSWKAHMLRLLDWLEESAERGPWYARQRRQVSKLVKFRRQDTDGGGCEGRAVHTLIDICTIELIGI